MRHFLLLATAIAGLAVGVIASPQNRALVTGAGPTLILPSSLLCAAAVAVDLVVLAAPTNQRQLAAASTTVSAQRGTLPSLALFFAR